MTCSMFPWWTMATSANMTTKWPTRWLDYLIQLGKDWNWSVLTNLWSTQWPTKIFTFLQCFWVFDDVWLYYLQNWSLCKQFIQHIKSTWNTFVIKIIISISVVPGSCHKYRASRIAESFFSLPSLAEMIFITPLDLHVLSIKYIKHLALKSAQG